MEIYKQIRKMRLDGMSQRQIAATLHISRNTVKKYWDGDSVPWERKDYSREASVLTEDVVAFVRQCLDEDNQCRSKKQHHTAKRIYDRLVAERGFTGGETTVRRLVKELREKNQEAFVPLIFPAGDALQNEKGLVEGLVGYIRRNVCVPVPKAESMEDLNRMLREKCLNYLSHQIRGKESSVGEMLTRERGKLYPLPGYPFGPCKRVTGRVDRFCTVRFDTNNYSVPAAYCGREVSVKAGPETVSIYFEGQCIARHRRYLDRKQNIYRLEHYLPLLEKKGRAIFYARPVQETLPAYFLNWLQEQNLSPKELVEILSCCREEDCDVIMAQAPCHAAPVRIEDTVVVQAVDLHAYDAFLCGKAGAAV